LFLRELVQWIHTVSAVRSRGIVQRASVGARVAASYLGRTNSDADIVGVSNHSIVTGDRRKNKEDSYCAVRRARSLTQ
jgi:hypothetical protein